MIRVGELAGALSRSHNLSDGRRLAVSFTKLVLPLAAILALAACNSEKSDNKRTNAPADSTTTTNPANPSNQNAPQPSSPTSR
jgi:uncharacterized lipoprotein YajG